MSEPTEGAAGRESGCDGDPPSQDTGLELPTDDVTSAQHDAADAATAPDVPEVAASDVPRASNSALLSENAEGKDFSYFNLPVSCGQHPTSSSQPIKVKKGTEFFFACSDLGILYTKQKQILADSMRQKTCSVSVHLENA